MILASIGPDAPFYRAFTPRWAHAPESGAGAPLAGGRFNRPGLQARYLAASADTALAEYSATALPGVHGRRLAKHKHWLGTPAVSAWARNCWA